MVGGFMLQNLNHLASIGVDDECPENTNWPAVYRRVGGYEGSKIESHFAVIRYMQDAGADYTIVHPATVCGHSESGHILEDNLWSNSFEIWHKVGSKRSPVPPGTGCQ
jgi:thioester reductase-like protein